LEKRNLYADKKGFNSNKETQRNIHLGVDYWCAAGTKVLTPIQGKVHSFKDNAIVGDYGPTIILEHNLAGERFYTLYGHLSRASLDSLYIGKTFTAGTVLGYLGTADINVNYAPHLHFQVIRDVQGNIGDYPGVCSQDNLAFYQENCPDPNLLLKIA
jgi:murein DD-endopeptidase MepM/ murein hydrolase activator NlpD